MVNWGSVHCGSRYTPPGTAGLCYLPSIPGTLNSCCHRHLYHHSASTPRPHSRYRSSFATPHPFCVIPVNAVGMSTNHVLNGPPCIPTPIRLVSSLRGRDSRIMLSQISPIFLTLVSMRSTSTITKALTNAVFNQFFTRTIPISHNFHLGAPKNDIMVDSVTFCWSFVLYVRHLIYPASHRLCIQESECRVRQNGVRYYIETTRTSFFENPPPDWSDHIAVADRLSISICMPPRTQTPWDCTVCVNPETKKVTQEGEGLFMRDHVHNEKD